MGCSDIKNERPKHQLHQHPHKFKSSPMLPDSKHQPTLANIGKTCECNRNGSELCMRDLMTVRKDNYLDAHVTPDVSSGEIVDTQFVASSKALDGNLIPHIYEITDYQKKCEAVDQFIQVVDKIKNANK